jgi:transcriptional regulator with XRE-family HTH domain
VPKRAQAEKQLPAFDLKASRVARKITQNKAKEILSTSQASITRWEKDGSMPSIYRKYWELYWRVEDVEQSKKKPDTSRKSKGDSKPTSRRTHSAGERGESDTLPSGTKQ